MHKQHKKIIGIPAVTIVISKISREWICLVWNVGQRWAVQKHTPLLPRTLLCKDLVDSLSFFASNFVIDQIPRRQPRNSRANELSSGDISHKRVTISSSDDDITRIIIGYKIHWHKIFGFSFALCFVEWETQSTWKMECLIDFHSSVARQIQLVFEH